MALESVSALFCVQAGDGSVQLQQPRKGGFSQTKLFPSQSAGIESDAVKVRQLAVASAHAVRTACPTRSGPGRFGSSTNECMHPMLVDVDPMQLALLMAADRDVMPAHPGPWYDGGQG